MRDGTDTKKKEQWLWLMDWTLARPHNTPYGSALLMAFYKKHFKKKASSSSGVIIHTNGYRVWKKNYPRNANALMEFMKMNF